MVFSAFVVRWDDCPDGLRYGLCNDSRRVKSYTMPWIPLQNVIQAYFPFATPLTFPLLLTIANRRYRRCNA